MESGEIKPGRGNETGEAADECIGIEGDMAAAGEYFAEFIFHLSIGSNGNTVGGKRWARTIAQ